MESVNYNKLQTLGITALLFTSLFINTGCTGIHRVDRSQVPIVRVSSGQSPTISWTPPHAYQISLYKGGKVEKGLGEVWSIGRHTGHQNRLASPITVDITLEKGETYTVAIQRKDPKGASDSFSNTRHRYIGVKTFKVK